MAKLSDCPLVKEGGHRLFVQQFIMTSSRQLVVVESEPGLVAIVTIGMSVQFTMVTIATISYIWSCEGSEIVGGLGESQATFLFHLEKKKRKE